MLQYNTHARQPHLNDDSMSNSASGSRMTCTFSSVFDWNVILGEELIEKVFCWPSFLTTP
jgi:hypothetical protein